MNQVWIPDKQFACDSAGMWNDSDPGRTGGGGRRGTAPTDPGRPSGGAPENPADGRTQLNKIKGLLEAVSHRVKIDGALAVVSPHLANVILFICPKRAHARVRGQGGFFRGLRCPGMCNEGWSSVFEKASSHLRT